MAKEPRPKKRKWIHRAVLVSINLVIAGGVYLSSIVWRCVPYHDMHSRWIGSAYEESEEYGFFPKPNQLAYHSPGPGANVPVLFDDEGFRIPHDAQQTEGAPPERRILFLGGSYTHGYGVPAEKTFSQLTGDAFDAWAMNAGGSGWGLTQMVLRARDVIPRLEPDFVVVQYSDWLSERSMELYAPTTWGKLPAPYFHEAEGGLEIHGPVFGTLNFECPRSEYGGEGLFPFVLNVGIPVFVHDDFLVLTTAAKTRLGILPGPTSDRRATEQFGYQAIQDLCDAHGATMLVLTLPGELDNRSELRAERAPWIVVETLEPLTERLPEVTEEAWARAYKLWQGNPPQLVDNHPSQRMHAIVAETLIDAIHTVVAANQRTAPPAVEATLPEDAPGVGTTGG